MMVSGLMYGAKRDAKIKILHQSIVLSAEFKQLTKFIKYLTRFYPVFWDRSSFFVISLIGAPYNAKKKLSSRTESAE